MRTQIRGKEAPWTPDILKLWERTMDGVLEEGQVVTMANYFTPRPYRNEYDRGSKTEGFCYVINFRVYIAEWRAIND